MTDLASWLLAQIEADEAVARAATPGPWRYNPGKEWFTDQEKLARARAGKFTTGGEEFVGAGPDDGDNTTTIGVAATGPSDNPQSMADAAHIAHWDPARVLAECAAKREIIRLHESWPVLVEQSPKFEQGDDPSTVTMRLTQQIAWLTQQEYRERFGAEPPTTPILRALALPYADWPGYREEWRP